MVRTIQSVFDGLILQVKEYGSREPTIELYRNVYGSLVNRCNKNGGELYTDLLPGEFLKKAEENFEAGKHCYEYFRLTKRAIRLLDTYARTGKADFSIRGNNKKYVPSPEHQRLISLILDENKLANDARVEMDTIMRHFFCLLEEASAEIYSVDDSVLFKFIKIAADTKKGTMYRVVRAVKLISEHLKKHGIVELKADFTMLQSKSAPVRMIAPYTLDEIGRIMNCIDSGTPYGMRDRAIMLLALETGLRAIDIIKLRLSDIDWKSADVHVAQSKTNEPLTLPLGGIVMNALADYILQARPGSESDIVFLSLKSPCKPIMASCSLGAIIEKYCKLAGVEKKPFRSFHSLRRTFATELSASGVPLPTISQLLGHKSFKEARPYLTYDRTQAAFCAMGFDGIPITGGIYFAKALEPPFLPLESGGEK